MRCSSSPRAAAAASCSSRSLRAASSRSHSSRTCICRISASWLATAAWYLSTVTSCSELRCSWALSRTLQRSASSSFSRRWRLSSRTSRSLRLISARASSRLSHISCVSATRFRRSLRSSAMTFSSMATFWVCALSSTWCSRVTFCIADLVSLTTLSSLTLVSVTSCSSFCVLCTACLAESSWSCRLCTCPCICFLSCCKLFRNSDSLTTWASRWLTSSRRLSASTCSCLCPSTSSLCEVWSFSSVASERSRSSVFRLSSICPVRCSMLRSLSVFCMFRRSSRCSQSSLSSRSHFSRRESRSLWISFRTCDSSSHCRSRRRISRCRPVLCSRSRLPLSDSCSSWSFSSAMRFVMRSICCFSCPTCCSWRCFCCAASMTLCL
mmetsp:Transcript_16336/g.46613  ORF Transcript_16336/g.46613 Transcript_16336/m.46613 type:complete len:381 (-) Transcript_16336:676-1818(-)